MRADGVKAHGMRVIQPLEQREEQAVIGVIQCLVELLRNDAALVLNAFRREIGTLHEIQQQRERFGEVLRRAEVIDRAVELRIGIACRTERRKLIVHIALFILKELMLQKMRRAGRKCKKPAAAAVLQMRGAEAGPDLRAGGAEAVHLRRADGEPAAEPDGAAFRFCRHETAPSLSVPRSTQTVSSRSCFAASVSISRVIRCTASRRSAAVRSSP